MLSQLKAEWRKLTSTRSTYIILGLSFALVIFYSFYVIGYRATSSGTASVHAGKIIDPNFLSSQLFSALQAVGVFGAIIAVLLAAHEYRYNTITYTLTLSNSRSKALFAKLLVALGFGVVYALIVSALSPTMVAMGLHAHHTTYVTQTFHWGNLLWRTAFYGAGYAAIALLIAFLLRNLVAAIVFLFLFPGTVEQLLGLWLKNNQAYLPFTSLGGVIGIGDNGGTKFLSPGHSALVFLAYLVGGWIIGWALFLKRDAN